MSTDTTVRLDYSWSHLNVYSTCEDEHSVRQRMRNYFPNCWRRMRPKQKSIPNDAVQLLHDVSGIARAGELLAIMGGSGAGKTTLLNTLAFRSAGDILVGVGSERCLNGIPITAQILRPNCAYVEQLDLFLGSLSAIEHLNYQSELRLNTHWSSGQRKQFVADIMTEMSLNRCANTTIGTPGQVKGLSGGEMKRLSFATALLSNPAIMLCDEPTSGLDSFMSRSVVQKLHQLASRGRTILITIHQPSSEIVGMFDKLLLMSAGKVAFYGAPAEALKFFDSIGSPCPPLFAATEHYVEVLGVRPGMDETDRPRVSKICHQFAGSPLGKEMMQTVIKIGERKSGQSFVSDTDDRKFQASCLRQGWVLYKRAGWSMLKKPEMIKARFFTTVAIALLIGGIYWQQQLNTDGVMNLNGAMFLILTTLTFQNVFSVIDVFCAEMPVFLRESREHLYRTDVYFFAKTLAECPLFVLTPILFLAIIYPMIGYTMSVEAVLGTAFICVLVANAAASFSYLMSCAAPSIGVAMAIAPPLIMPVMLFSGFYLNLRSVPKLLVWCPYISWLRYGFEGWAIVQWREYGSGSFDCNGLQPNCATSGAMILKQFHFDEENLWLDYVALIVMSTVLRVGAFVALLLRSMSAE